MGVTGCTLALWSNERQCETSGDCERLLGPRFAGAACDAGACIPRGEDWRCFGQPSPGAGGARGEPIQVVFRAVGTDPTVPLPRAKVQVCTKFEGLDGDAECKELGIASQETDEAGGAIFDGIGRGFDGYFKLTRDDIRTVLYFPGRLVHDVETLTPVGGLTEPAFQGIVDRVTETPPPKGGAALLYVKDCSGALAPGVRVSARGHDDALSFYVRRQVPVRTESQTTLETPGQAGFFNLPDNQDVTFDAVHVETGTSLPAAVAPIRAGTITVVGMAPTP